MTVIRRYKPTYRIAQLMHAPGGVPLSVALERAEAALEEVRESCERGIDAKIEQLAALTDAEDVGSQGEAMYALSDEIFAESGAFGMEEVSDAAHSLCTLIAADVTRHLAAIRVHTDALRALRHREVSADAEKRAAVLAGLRNVTARFAKRQA